MIHTNLAGNCNHPEITMTSIQIPLSRAKNIWFGLNLKEISIFTLLLQNCTDLYIFKKLHVGRFLHLMTGPL